MCPLDERILELLREDSLSTPGYIAREVELFASVGRVTERCYMLADAELIDSPTTDRQHWEITQAGEWYLDGKLDVRDQPTPRLKRLIDQRERVCRPVFRIDESDQKDK